MGNIRYALPEITMLTVPLVLALLSNSHAEHPADAPKGTVEIEAEGTVGLQTPFRVVGDEECSGGTCVTIPRGVGKPASQPSRATYVARIGRKATYRAWLRVKWTDGDGNSLFLAVPGREPSVVGQDGTYGRWHWAPGPDVELTKGSHSLVILHREDGVSLDRILLVPDTRFVPVGTKGIHVPSGWEAEDLYFADDFSRSGDTQVRIWDSVAGDWKINFVLDPNKLPNFHSYVGRAEEQGLAVAGYRFWKDYRVDAAIKPLGCAALGVVFSFTSPEHYLLVRWVKDTQDKGRLELCRVADGEQKVLRAVPCPRLDDVWSLLSVRAWSDEVAVLLDGYPVLEEKGVSLSGGKAGLYVFRGRAAFDNVEVSAIRRFRGDFAGPSRWRDVVCGEWIPSRDSSLIAKGDPEAAMVTGAADWRDYEVRTEVERTKKTWGVLACWRSPRDFYRFEASKDEFLLVRKRDDTRSVLASVKRDARPPKIQRFVLRRAGAHLAAYVGGRLVIDAWDDHLSAGHPGLFVGSKSRLTFRSFEVEFLDTRVFSHEIEACSFLQPRVVDPTDVPDLTPEQYRETVESERSALLRRNAKHYAIVGKGRSGALWAANSGTWSVSDEQLHVDPGDGEALAYQNRQAPGDMAVKAEICQVGVDGGDVGLVAHGFRADPSHGYRLVLAPGRKRLVLYRSLQEVAAVALPNLADRVSLELWCSGNQVIGWLDRRIAISYMDPDPLDGEEAGLLARGGPAHFDEISLHAIDYRGRSLFYAYHKPAPDWLPVGGEFRLHGGVSCLRASSWLSMLGQEENALMWHKRTTEGALSVGLKAMEHSMWYGWDKRPTHAHTAYKNIGIALCADGKDITSGYAVIVNGWNLARSVITRKGRVVASVAQGPDFPCVYQGGHAPLSPRWSSIRVSLRGDTVQLRVNGVPVLGYKDPEPLSGGMVGVWCWDAAMNIGDVHLAAGTVLPRSPSELAETMDAGAPSVARLVGRAEKDLSEQSQ